MHPSNSVSEILVMSTAMPKSFLPHNAIWSESEVPMLGIDIEYEPCSRECDSADRFARRLQDVEKIRSLSYIRPH